MDGETQMNEEMAEKLVGATSAADVQSIANSYGKELTMEQAQEIYDKIQSFSADGELSDEELAAVSGGIGRGIDPRWIDYWFYGGPYPLDSEGHWIV